jgi:hypothetical protein
MRNCERQIQVNQKDKGSVATFVKALTPIREELISKFESRYSSDVLDRELQLVMQRDCPQMSQVFGNLYYLHNSISTKAQKKIDEVTNSFHKHQD